MPIVIDELIELTRSASIRTMEMREEGLESTAKADYSPSSRADTEAECIIFDGLRESGHTFLSMGEETGLRREDGATLVSLNEESPTVVVAVDGIDGTKNFLHRTMWGWCTTVAVQENGETTMAVIHDPVTDRTYWAQKDKGAFVTNHRTNTTVPTRIPEHHDTDFNFCVGHFQIKELTPARPEIMNQIRALGKGAGERYWGCIALSICDVGMGGTGAFVQPNSFLHDHAAAILFAQEAGAYVRVTPVHNPKGGPEPCDNVIIAHPELADRVVQIFDQCVSELGLKIAHQTQSAAGTYIR